MRAADDSAKLLREALKLLGDRASAAAVENALEEMEIEAYGASWKKRLGEKGLRRALRSYRDGVTSLQSKRLKLWRAVIKAKASPVIFIFNKGDKQERQSVILHRLIKGDERFADAVDRMLAQELKAAETLLAVPAKASREDAHGLAAVGAAMALLGPEYARASRRPDRRKEREEEDWALDKNRAELDRLAAILYGEPNKDMLNFILLYRQRHHLTGTPRNKPSPKLRRPKPGNK
jgi:hypothetical protein